MATNVHGQNLDKIGKEGMLKVSGGLSFNTVTYAQSGLIIPTRDPFAWYASGNLNLSILDVSLPFTYTYSNLAGGNFRQPFNRAAIHPSYKWIKTHIGLVNMNFSPYTLSGHLFLGGGIELTPGKWKIQAMGGRLQKAVQYDALLNNIDQMTYQRFGYGLKVGYENKGYSGEVILLKANDQSNSLNFIPLNSTVRPQDNLVMSIKGKAKIISGLNIEAEYALSGLTQNVNEINDLNSGSQNFIHPLINGNATTDFFNAYNASIKYSLKFMKLGFKYEHVDPGYLTLGGYYFNNDIENFTFTPAFTLFKKKLNIALNTGFQRNNLDNTKEGTTNRWIGSATTTYIPSSKFVLTGTYSNFSTFTQNRPVTDPFYYQPADTLNFFQLTQSASGMISYNFGEKSIKSVIQLLYNYQESTNLSGNVQNAGAFGTGVQTSEAGIPSKVHMTNASYTAQLASIESNLTFAANMNRTNMLDQKSTFFGPTLNFQKGLFNKKGNLGAGVTYNRQYTNADLASNIMNYRLSFQVNPELKNQKFGKFGITANANLMQRFAVIATQTNVSELNVTINLNYNF